MTDSDEAPLEFCKPIHPFAEQSNGGFIVTPHNERFRAEKPLPEGPLGKETGNDAAGPLAPVPASPEPVQSFDLGELRALSDESLRAILRQLGLTDDQRRSVSQILTERFSQIGGITCTPQAPVVRTISDAPPVLMGPPPKAEIPAGTFLSDIDVVLKKWLPASVADMIFFEVKHSGNIPSEFLKS